LTLNALLLVADFYSKGRAKQRVWDTQIQHTTEMFDFNGKLFKRRYGNLIDRYFALKNICHCGRRKSEK
jgi:hypothetical protein